MRPCWGHTIASSMASCPTVSAAPPSRTSLPSPSRSSVVSHACSGLVGAHLRVRRRQHVGQLQRARRRQRRSPQAERPLRRLGSRGRGRGVQNLRTPMPERQHPRRGQLRAQLGQPHQLVGPLEFLLHLSLRCTPRAAGSAHRASPPPAAPRALSNDSAAAPCPSAHDVVTEHRPRGCAAGRGKDSHHGVPQQQPATELGRILGHGIGVTSEPGPQALQQLPRKVVAVHGRGPTRNFGPGRCAVPNRE